MKDAIRIMLNRHRQDGVMCPASCFCWDVSGYLDDLEAAEHDEMESADYDKLSALMG